MVTISSYDEGSDTAFTQFMAKQLSREIKKRSPLPTIHQTSAGGIVFRHGKTGIEVVLISVGEASRWQLPKGLVDEGESLDETALREVREETGLDARLLQPIDVIEYWFYGQSEGERVRFHKQVHFFLMAYQSGNVQDHDFEVNEARWVALNDAIAMLAFKSEQALMMQARDLIANVSLN